MWCSKNRVYCAIGESVIGSRVNYSRFSSFANIVNIANGTWDTLRLFHILDTIICLRSRLTVADNSDNGEIDRYAKIAGCGCNRDFAENIRRKLISWMAAAGGIFIVRIARSARLKEQSNLSGTMRKTPRVTISQYRSRHFWSTAGMNIRRSYKFVISVLLWNWCFTLLYRGMNTSNQEIMYRFINIFSLEFLI